MNTSRFILLMGIWVISNLGAIIKKVLFTFIFVYTSFCELISYVWNGWIIDKQYVSVRTAKHFSKVAAQSKTSLYESHSSTSSQHFVLSVFSNLALSGGCSMLSPIFVHVLQV